MVTQMAERLVADSRVSSSSPTKDPMEHALISQSTMCHYITMKLWYHKPVIEVACLPQMGSIH